MGRTSASAGRPLSAGTSIPTAKPRDRAISSDRAYGRFKDLRPRLWRRVEPDLVNQPDEGDEHLPAGCHARVEVDMVLLPEGLLQDRAERGNPVRD